MATTTKAAKAERAEAIAQLRELIKPGDTVYTILDHVSSSGMSRAIRVLVPMIDGVQVESVAPGGKPTDYIRRDSIAVDFRHPNWAVGKALGLRHWKRNGREQDALVVGGCGMDMGFHLVYELSHVLYGGRLVPDVYKDSATHDQPGGQLLTREGAPEGHVYLGGYQCLGKGKCPSNYHVNHRDTVQCEGTRVYNPDGPDSGERCHWSREHGGWIIGGWEDDEPWELCPTCKGKGRLPNPEGPERFDLVHTDGYALRHRWL